MHRLVLNSTFVVRAIGVASLSLLLGDAIAETLSVWARGFLHIILHLRLTGWVSMAMMQRGANLSRSFVSGVDPSHGLFGRLFGGALLCGPQARYRAAHGDWLSRGHPPSACSPLVNIQALNIFSGRPRILYFGCIIVSDISPLLRTIPIASDEHGMMLGVGGSCGILDPRDWVAAFIFTPGSSTLCSNGHSCPAWRVCDCVCACRPSRSEVNDAQDLRFCELISACRSTVRGLREVN